jgi:hypothetical protein
MEEIAGQEDERRDIEGRFGAIDEESSAEL